jgi:hypothetical protein
MVGAVLAGARQWAPASALLTLGAVWYFLRLTWYARRISSALWSSSSLP